MIPSKQQDQESHKKTMAERLQYPGNSTNTSGVLHHSEYRSQTTTDRQQDLDSSRKTMAGRLSFPGESKNDMENKIQGKGHDKQVSVADVQQKVRRRWGKRGNLQKKEQGRLVTESTAQQKGNIVCTVNQTGKARQARHRHDTEAKSRHDTQLRDRDRMQGNYRQEQAGHKGCTERNQTQLVEFTPGRRECGKEGKGRAQYCGKRIGKILYGRGSIGKAQHCREGNDMAHDSKQSTDMAYHSRQGIDKAPCSRQGTDKAPCSRQGTDKALCNREKTDRAYYSRQDTDKTLYSSKGIGKALCTDKALYSRLGSSKTLYSRHSTDKAYYNKESTDRVQKSGGDTDRAEHIRVTDIVSYSRAKRRLIREDKQQYSENKIKELMDETGVDPLVFTMNYLPFHSENELSSSPPHYSLTLLQDSPEENEAEVLMPSYHQLDLIRSAYRTSRKFILNIGNVPFRRKQSEVRAFFSKYQNMIGFWMPIHKDDESHRGFARVTYNNEDSFRKALTSDWKQLSLDGRSIRLNGIWMMCNFQSSELQSVPKSPCHPMPRSTEIIHGDHHLKETTIAQAVKLLDAELNKDKKENGGMNLETEWNKNEVEPSQATKTLPPPSHKNMIFKRRYSV